MAEVQVTCVNKQPRTDPYEGITHLGGYGWRWTRGEVIASINAGVNRFFTMVNGSRSEIGVVNGPYGPYLRTHSNGYWNDNLLALNECYLY
ncbi:MAG: DUF3892 domain-containing protein [Deltaproteobacteria bacterium]|nr:DUF3892 domain-containing protein [Deltaproteobacteria bacterium]